MFRWYADSAVCYAYLSDVAPNTGDISLLIANLDCYTSKKVSGPVLEDSRWFRRGWTLQELLAPRKLVFYASDWSEIATREDLCARISQITSIDEYYLMASPTSRRSIDSILDKASIAERMSWASNRETTREEDMAYCLLGLFGINMPLLYGEGRAAFRRLQEEIIRVSDDQTIFAWNYDLSRHGSAQVLGCLAYSPKDFAACGHLVPCHWGNERPAGGGNGGGSSSVYSLTNKGLQITLPMLGKFALLQCQPRDDPTKLVVICLWPWYDNVYDVVREERSMLVDQSACRRWKRKSIYIFTRPNLERALRGHTGCSFFIRNLPKGFHIQRPSGYRPSDAIREVDLFTKWSPLGYKKEVERTLILSQDDSKTAIDTGKEENGARRIRLRLTARKVHHVYENKAVPRMFWVSYRLSFQHSTSDHDDERRSQEEQPRYLGQGEQPEGTEFLLLPDGRILHAEITQQDIFSSRVLLVDLFTSSSGSLKMRSLQLWSKLLSVPRLTVDRFVPAVLQEFCASCFWNLLGLSLRLRYSPYPLVASMVFSMMIIFTSSYAPMVLGRERDQGATLNPDLVRDLPGWATMFIDGITVPEIILRFLSKSTVAWIGWLCIRRGMKAIVALPMPWYQDRDGRQDHSFNRVYLEE
ncbi:hypothetical protein B0H66DRAFT_555506 [Apodospora peruviana]|uniref:DUF8212 domain-containing protein n=1 Tax=Apodospora peruviana TaxID=516989 RepID=A0AAE0IEQ7_9PEZI|nr:hypothetical protein B0H66DRAFT_555506 [Apodospora peruviana]